MEDRKRYWKGKHVFVTGSTGFLGSWLAQYLIDYEAEVTGLVRDFVPLSRLFQEEHAGKINLVQGKLEDRELLERILGEYEIDTVFHVGAQTIVTIANRNPISTFNANIRGTWNVLEACRRSPLVKRIVVASSDKAYGDQTILPYSEDMPLLGRHPYDASKSCADMLAQTYAETYKLPVCITRCGNFYGGGDLNFNRVIPGTIYSLLEHEIPIIRSNGKMIRDYFYIEDGVNAYLCLAEYIDKLKSYGEAFNFSNENQITVEGIVNTIISLMGSNVQPKILNMASNEIEHQYLSAEKARKFLAWRPLYTLEEGLEKTIAWYRKFFSRYHRPQTEAYIQSVLARH